MMLPAMNRPRMQVVTRSRDRQVNSMAEVEKVQQLKKRKKLQREKSNGRKVSRLMMKMKG